jgi:hypothetical protein
MIYRVLALVVCGFLLTLSACGSATAEPTPVPPPEFTPYQPSKDKNIDALLTSFDSNIRTYLTKPEQGYTPGEKEIYDTSLDLPGVKQFYDSKMAASGWNPVPNGPNDTPNRILLSYQKSNTLFIVTAIDSSAYLGQGVVVYTIRATK